SPDLDPVLRRIDTDLDASLERLFTFLRIPSISTDPAYKQPCRQAAQWVGDALSELGFATTVHKTDGQPMVLAHFQAPDKQAPHVLFYGHYDVQPPDPLDLWAKPPFEPYIETRDGHKCIVARGACDDKGQLMTFLEACRALKAETGNLPVSITALIEGEEESGSPSLAPFLDAHAGDLKCDLALVCDTGMWDRDTPAISTRLRGLVAEEVVLTGPSRDLHSGMYGGPAMNPIRALSHILAAIHDSAGRVTIEGFYDGVDEVDQATADQWATLGFDGKKFLADIDLSQSAGESDRSMLEQIWSRPTAEINGIIGGYTGAGTKTVIPSVASAKLTFRLVGRQDPAKIRAAFRAFVTQRLPADVTAQFLLNEGAPAITMPTHAPAFRLAAKALADEWQKPAAMIGCGGSIPIVDSFKNLLGMDTVLIGFGLEDDSIHSPNEKYDLRSYHKGTRSWARVLVALGQGIS
ncbi:MAG: M20/M25/M40 family metallo-hydrolase, partial [Alphaproteobacteria bacterium]